MRAVELIALVWDPIVDKLMTFTGPAAIEHNQVKIIKILEIKFSCLWVHNRTTNLFVVAEIFKK